MGLWEDAGWLTTAGVYSANSWAGQHINKKKAEEVEEIVRQMTDPLLEGKVQHRVHSASPEEFDEIWVELEMFKRDNPHLILPHANSSYWGHVGKWRFPFTREQYCRAHGKTRLTKSDDDMLIQLKGWTVTLLMNTYGKFSKMEATRIAFQKVFGPGHDTWTTQFG